MAIRCGHCGAIHDTADDVRRCHQGTLDEPRLPSVAAPPVPALALAALAGHRGFAGPDALGRNVVVTGGGEPPDTVA